MTKLTVGVFFGSRSAEHDVSIVTAISSIIKPLLATDEYHVVPVYIAKDGRWFCDPRLSDIKTYQTGLIDTILSKTQPLQLQIGGGLTLVKPGLRGKKIAIDVAFPATHGTHGEDGELMGIFEMAGIPYVGCDLASSAVAMNKVTSKLVVEAHGILTPKFQFFTKAEFEADPERVVKGVLASPALKSAKPPFFVKPAHLGSSIGITRVSEISELQNAIEVAAHYDELILVEQGVNNLIEVTLPIMGDVELKTALVERALTTAEDFFDFDTKYIGGGKKTGGKKSGSSYSELPAKIPEAIYKQCEEVGLRAYQAIGCSGIARVDMLIDKKEEKVYFNEINPLPGSLYVHNWQKAGVSAVELVKQLIELGIKRHARREKLNTTFETNFLKQF